MKRTQLSIHTMGVVTYQTLCEFLIPEPPAEKDYEAIEATVDMVLYATQSDSGRTLVYRKKTARR
jgi:hypothetical protein